MKKLLSLALLLGLIPTAAEAATIVGVYTTGGNCNAAWNHTMNNIRKGSDSGVYWCEHTGAVWILYEA